MTLGDPGWDVSWKTLLVPQLAMRAYRKGGGGNPLVVLRRVFLAFCSQLLLFAVVLAAIAPGQDWSDPVITLGLGLVLVGASAQLVGRMVERPLDCATDEALATSYRTRFFLRVAFAETAALLGFVGYFVALTWWSYPIGAAIAAVGLWRAAPTARHLDADQEGLSQQQCGRSLSAALQSRGHLGG